MLSYFFKKIIYLTEQVDEKKKCPFFKTCIIKYINHNKNILTSVVRVVQFLCVMCSCFSGLLRCDILYTVSYILLVATEAAHDTRKTPFMYFLTVSLRHYHGIYDESKKSYDI